MTIARYAEDHGIGEIVHFTTNKGLLGISFTNAVLPRRRLRREEILEYIIQINAETRLDPAWFDHVNMSLNDINRRFFAASEIWHRDLWWAILAFDPAILSDPGVTFVNTNNGWRGAHVLRTEGLDGLRMIYEDDVDHGRGWAHHQACGATPTCPQAEVLYPGPLSLEHLRRVYVRDQANYREACSYLTFLGWEVPVEIDPDRFRPYRTDPCRA